MKSDYRANLEISLGPAYELHSGAHLPLRLDPPPGCSYHVDQGRYVFLGDGPHRPSPFSPHSEMHFFEGVDFAAPKDIIHASRWPVVGHKAWVVDVDDLGYPVIAGRYAISPAFSSLYRGERSSDFTSRVRRRASTMLSAYAHDSCKAVIFHSQEALESARFLTERYSEGAVREKCLSKFIRIYPATRAVSGEYFYSKWSERTPLRIVYCGREFLTKRGDIALAVLDELRKIRDVDITYIGMIPDSHRVRYADLIDSIDHVPFCDRNDVIAAFSNSHVLFHPSDFEALGIVFLEAVACGLAVVCAQGGRMPDLTEIFGDQGALFVRRSSDILFEEEVEIFLSYLVLLSDNWSLARSMAHRNFNEAGIGQLSIERRDQLLAQVYECARSSPAVSPLRAEEIELEGASLFRLTEDELDADLMDARKKVRQETGLSNSRLDFSDPYP